MRTREREETAEEKLLRAAHELLRGGPACFKVSTRVKAELLPWWKRLVVAVCRKALGSPAAQAMQLTVYTSWAGALKECETSDDQLLAMPLNRSYARDRLDVAVECRPRDPEDVARFKILSSVFGGDARRGQARHVRMSVDDVEQITSDLTDIRRMTEPRL